MTGDIVPLFSAWSRILPGRSYIEVLSCKRLKVWAYHFFNSAHSRELQELFRFKALPFAVEFKRLNGRIEADLISILEAIGDCLLRTIDANWNTVYLVCLDPMSESLP